MGSLKVAIELEESKTAFRPGGVMQGSIRVDAPAAWEPEFLELVVFWRTEGRGTQDSASILHDKYHEGAEHISSPFEHPFTVRLPDMPWTYHGDMIKIHWYAGLYAKAKGEDEEFIEQNFVLHPNPEGLTLRR